MKKLSALIFALPFVLPAMASAQTPGTGIDLCPKSFEQICGDANSLFAALGSVISFIFIIAIILALGFLIYGGIRWLVSGGDKGKVEEARGTIIAAIIGLIVIFLSYVILSFVLNLFGVELNHLSIPSINLYSKVGDPCDYDKTDGNLEDGVMDCADGGTEAGCRLTCQP